MPTNLEILSKMQDGLRASERELQVRAKQWRVRAQNYSDAYFLKEETHSHQFSVNIVRGLTSIIVPAVYYQDPRILASPRRSIDIEGAKVSEALLNYWIKELRYKKQAKQCVIDAWLFGPGYMKIGYNLEIERTLEPVTREDGTPLSTNADEPTFSDKFGNIFIERMGRLEQVMDKDGNIPPIGQEIILPSEYMRRGQPFSKRWAPWDVLFDPETTEPDLSDATWIAFRALVPLEAIKNNPMYENTASLKATFISPDFMGRDEYQIPRIFWDVEGSLKDRVEIYEVWSKEWNKELHRYDYYQSIITKDFDKFLIRQKSPYRAEGFPLKVLFFDSDPITGRPISPLDAVDSQINTINLVRSMIANFRDQFKPKYVLNLLSGMTLEDAIKLIRGDEEVTTATIEDAQAGINGALQSLKIPEINPILFDDYRMAMQEIQFILGVNDYQASISGPAREPTEAGLIQQGSNARLEEKRQSVGDFVSECFIYLHQLLKQLAHDKQVVKITGLDGAELWRQITPVADIPDDLDIEVDIMSSRPQLQETKIQMAMMKYNQLRKDPLVNGQVLVDDTLRAFGEVAPERFRVQQQPTPQHGGAAAAEAIDQNDLRQPLGGEQPSAPISGENL